MKLKQFLKTFHWLFAYTLIGFIWNFKYYVSRTRTFRRKLIILCFLSQILFFFLILVLSVWTAYYILFCEFSIWFCCCSMFKIIYIINMRSCFDKNSFSCLIILIALCIASVLHIERNNCIMFDVSIKFIYVYYIILYIKYIHYTLNLNITYLI